MPATRNEERLHEHTPCVLFCRAAAEVEESKASVDPYQAECERRGFSARFLPVIEHISCNVDLLLDYLDGRYGSPADCGGLIVTSQRAVETLDVALRKHVAQYPESSTLAWRSVPVYVVGESTKQAVEGLNEGLVTRGSHCGTAQALAELILQDLTATGQPNTWMLFLAGDKRRNVIPDAVAASNAKLHEICVYKTQANSRLEHDLLQALEKHERPDWVVFFSPSGVDMTLPTFQQQSWWGKTAIGSIGPTTTAKLMAEGLSVAAEAARPNPLSLLDAIVHAPSTTE
ncbi:tetrapyrrole biosynthesis, uroporphyrinogen III synthase [Polychytrium aggregatum]|uniref:tetrapyrrole biosynthesis, uroporphyrinogen III synthase n=1 Tax=Polychytrium aggregatum TaxID=110093 RepID=UPI0022FDE04C|nr:tetrapyrrole biosynthesis, uroporphyrinogen III synthase [Polychytrium aggregatum]KAI9206571.1 tetrapyrrole biosynthesis, uroporphyrinogen III synthase [Polychytrium aggregatum]